MRFRIRPVLLVVTTICGLSAAAFFFTFQLFENEPSLAGTDPMVITDIEVFQDTTSVLKGTPMQLALGINIHTKGKAQPLNFLSMEIAARGTTQPYEDFINNARLWCTGNTGYFIPVKQTGETVSNIPEDNFTVGSMVKLLEGDNFFWVTFDVSQLPGSRINQLDAECIRIQIGTLYHEPSISAPPGNRKIINNIPFYSTGNSDISSLDSWNSLRDGSGNRPSNFNQLNATFHIQPGHILRNDLNACISYLLIERNGVLLSNSGIKSDRLEILGGGTMVQTKPLQEVNIEKFIIRNGANYIHQNNGKIPGSRKQFESFSNVLLNEYSSETFSQQINWGNLVIDADSNASADIATAFHNIGGNLEIRSTGGNFLYSSITDTITIEGSMVMSGGSLLICGQKSPMVLCVNRELILKGGCLADGLPGKATKGSLVIYPGKMVYLKTGQFRMSGKHSAILFREEQVSWKQDLSNFILPDITVLPGCTLSIAGRELGMIGADRKLLVSSTSMIDCGTTVISGMGSFILEPHSALATAHPEGIHSDALAGSIQTQKRFYSSSADFAYNGISNPQQTGIFKTAPGEKTINQMTIQKTSVNSVVILQQDIKVTGRLVKACGNINKNSFRLEAGELTTARAAY